MSDADGPSYRWLGSSVQAPKLEERKISGG
jgi:hypothetical protein